MEKKLVSIIVPAYNGEKHLAATLETIINQDYENLEIIFVNDASTDNTLKIAEDILKNSGRVYKIINHEKNSGVSVSRNDGLDAARGEYIWFCDSDDLPDKSFISIMYRKIEDENADLVFCNLKYFYENENRYEDLCIYNNQKTLSGEECLKICAEKNNCFTCIWNCLINNNFLRKIKLRFKKGCIYAEDGEFAKKIVVVASKVAFELRCLYVYVQHSNQTTRVSNLNENPRLFVHAVLARYRTARYIMKRTKDKKIKNYLRCYYIADMFLKQSKMCIASSDLEYYNKKVKTTRHKNFRRFMLSSTAHFLIKDPGLLLNSFLLLYFPNFYYKVRSKKSK